MDYRRDIDGLRALAVVPVVLYHAPGEFLTGGFVGVDVFFVISGYLITRILLRELAVGRFSLLDFYERRARRILPALVAVLVFTTVVSFFVLLPAEFRNFGQSLGATMLFVSNFFFWSESNYFAGAAEFRPLLHTWSLAVEEQFYILHPLLLAGLFYVSKVRAVLLFTGIIVLSFIASLWAVANYPSAAFYLLPFRAWELGVGALLAFHAVPKIGDPRLREIAGIVGLALVAYAVVAFDSTTPFPGAAALLPCLGAALLIHAGSSGGCAASRLLALPPLVAVGLISYSLYLWHWPVFVLQSLYLMREPTAWEGAAAIAFAVAMSVLSWRYVEQPFRRRRIAAGRAPIFVTATTSIVAGLVLGGILHLSGGMPSRLAPEARELAHVGPFTGVAADDCFAPPAAAVRAGELCRVGAAGEPSFLIWGDSHARAMGTAIDEAGGRSSIAASVRSAALRSTVCRAGCPGRSAARRTLWPTSSFLFGTRSGACRARAA
ncbi:MAG: acyltransferase family protein [Deinococcus-Thermus bacterium]|jgi:peptidoglycan/LPS O-acetylase OafA/YrhL|nr:acyltransferase family protein [Deinococcota bacterium]